MKRPEDLRAKGAKSRRLAATMTDTLTVERVQQLAAELEEQADAEEAKIAARDQH